MPTWHPQRPLYKPLCVSNSLNKHAPFTVSSSFPVFSLPSARALEKSMRDDRLNTNPRNPSTLPSFSSSLLDEIYRSIDNRNDQYRRCKDGIGKKKLSNGGRLNARGHRNSVIKDNADFPGTAKSGSSSFYGTRPAPVRTSRSETLARGACSEKSGYLFDYNRQGKNLEDPRNEANLKKLKLRALTIYSNQKKVKKPISPGARLARFVNSLFSNGNAKKTQKLKPAQTSSSCPSASSYYRSCIKRNSLNSKERSDGGVKRTVRFCPVNVILGEDCEEKSIHGEAAREIAKKGSYRTNGVVMMNKDEEDDEVSSDSSSDLFEIDHLGFIGEDVERYREELPVYETTRIVTDRAIANGLMAC
ncbi:hypothetical protein NMG60_11001743 [Bertholletia excelsa]